MNRIYIVYYPIGEKQTAQNILQLLLSGADPSTLDLPRGYRIETVNATEATRYVDNLTGNSIEDLFDIGGEG